MRGQRYTSRVRPLHLHRDRQLMAWGRYWLELLILLAVALIVAAAALLLR